MLERHNINLAGEGPYSGGCSFEQLRFLRPFAGPWGHKEAAIRRLHHIGAFMHPGSALSGTSSHLAAMGLG
jgi:phytoene dehydrogenase-like protein